MDNCRWSKPAIRSLRDQPPSTFLLKIQNFFSPIRSQLAQQGIQPRTQYYESQSFSKGGYTWKLIVYPLGNPTDGGKDHISLYLQIQDTGSFPTDWKVEVDMKLCVHKWDKNNFLVVQDFELKRFNARNTEWGFALFLPIDAFKEGVYLQNDSCEFGAEILIIEAAQKPGGPALVDDPGTGSITHPINSSQSLDTQTAQRPDPSNSSKIQRTFRALDPAHCIFMVHPFSKLYDEAIEYHESHAFSAGGFRWRLALYPRGCRERKDTGQISLYLRILETDNFQKSWNVHAFFRFFIRDQINDKYLMIQESLEEEICNFHEKEKEHALVDLLSFKEFSDPVKGYLVDDKCCVGAEVFVVSSIGTKPVELSADKTYDWVVENFSELQRIDRCFHSPPFTFGGTQWILMVYPNGDRPVKNSWLSAFLIPHESWKLSGRKEMKTDFSIILCNMATGGNVTKTPSGQANFKYLHIGWGVHEIIPLWKLKDEREGFKKDDKLHFQVRFNSMTVEEKVL